MLRESITIRKNHTANAAMANKKYCPIHTNANIGSLAPPTTITVALAFMALIFVTRVKASLSARFQVV